MSDSRLAIFACVAGQGNHRDEIKKILHDLEIRTTVEQITIPNRIGSEWDNPDEIAFLCENARRKASRVPEETTHIIINDEPDKRGEAPHARMFRHDEINWRMLARRTLLFNAVKPVCDTENVGFYRTPEHRAGHIWRSDDQRMHRRLKDWYTDHGHFYASFYPRVFKPVETMRQIKYCLAVAHEAGRPTHLMFGPTYTPYSQQQWETTLAGISGSVFARSIVLWYQADHFPDLVRNSTTGFVAAARAHYEAAATRLIDSVPMDDEEDIVHNGPDDDDFQPDDDDE